MNNDNNKPTDPISSKNEVKESNDPKIDQDVPGFPDKPSSEEELNKKDPAPKAHDNEVVEGDDEKQ